MYPYCVSLHDTLGNYVVIGNTKISINHKNEGLTKPLPTSFAKRGTTTPEGQTLIINLVSITKSYIITGEILQGLQEYASGLNETKTNAKDKMDLLFSMIESGLTMTINIGDGVNRNGMIKDDSLTIDSKDTQATPNDGEAVFPITFTFVVGVDRLASTT